MRKLEVNDIPYCDNGSYGMTDVQKFIVIKVTPTTATVNNVQYKRIELIINREPSECWKGEGFRGKGESKNKVWYLGTAQWGEKYERQNLIAFLYNAFQKSDWQKFPTDKLKELKNLIS